MRNMFNTSLNQFKETSDILYLIENVIKNQFVIKKFHLEMSKMLNLFQHKKQFIDA